MTAMAWRIARIVAETNVPTVVTTLAATALTLSTAAVFSARRSNRRVDVVENDAECRKVAARWLASPQGQRWVALKSRNLDIPDTDDGTTNPA
jgi:hypothetical protein